MELKGPEVEPHTYMIDNFQQSPTKAIQRGKENQQTLPENSDIHMGKKKRTSTLTSHNTPN